MASEICQITAKLSIVKIYFFCGYCNIFGHCNGNVVWIMGEYTHFHITQLYQCLCIKLMFNNTFVNGCSCKSSWLCCLCTSDVGRWSIFHMWYIFHSHNSHIWSQSNSSAIHLQNHWVYWFINVWSSILSIALLNHICSLSSSLNTHLCYFFRMCQLISLQTYLHWHYIVHNGLFQPSYKYGLIGYGIPKFRCEGSGWVTIMTINFETYGLLLYGVSWRNWYIKLYLLLKKTCSS